MEIITFNNIHKFVKICNERIIFEKPNNICKKNRKKIGKAVKHFRTLHLF